MLKLVLLSPFYIHELHVIGYMFSQIFEARKATKILFTSFPLMLERIMCR
uniref:Uncharacterized protein n=1 Tax=Arundo donax TaxID=35708 RepID=A0A0A9GWE5_ARUDO